MGLSQEVHDAGQEVASATEATLSDALNRVLGRFLGWPYRVSSACVVDRDDNRTERFASVAYVASGSASDPEPDCVPADAAAAVVDACGELDLEAFRAAYERVAQAKRLGKSPAPHLEGTPVTTVTLGIIFGLRSALPMDGIAEELERLNTETSWREWPDMVVVLSAGVVDYAAQFPGQALMNYLPPAEGALASYTPPTYVVMVIRPTGSFTFNRMVAVLIAHLTLFSPGADLLNANHILQGMPRKLMPVLGYQYNLGGDLLPVPRQFYSDRYLPPLPWRVEDQQGNLLSTLEFLPWQDGGVILLRGKLPLEGLLIFLGKAALQRAGTVRMPDAQLSYVLPITRADFGQMLRRIQTQTNMVVRRQEPKLVLQKVSDEGSSSPVVARLLMGVMRLRDQIYSDDASREQFDRLYELVTSPLLNARTTAREIVQLWAEHVHRIASGKIARLQGQTVHVNESIDGELRRQVESFLNTAVRALKQGMQGVAAELGVQIGFLFEKQAAFANGLAALEVADPALAAYLGQTRTWSHRLVEECRNALEHKGWTLPRVTYPLSGTSIEAAEPPVAGQPVSQFVTFMLDRLLCFVEEVTVHCLQKRLPVEFTITEILLTHRLAEVPQRFTLTLASGGRPAWQIAYHSSTFEET